MWHFQDIAVSLSQTIHHIHNAGYVLCDFPNFGVSHGAYEGEISECLSIMAMFFSLPKISKSRLEEVDTVLYLSPFGTKLDETATLLYFCKRRLSVASSKLNP